GSELGAKRKRQLREHEDRQREHGRERDQLDRRLAPLAPDHRSTAPTVSSGSGSTRGTASLTATLPSRPTCTPTVLASPGGSAACTAASGESPRAAARAPALAACSTAIAQRTKTQACASAATSSTRHGRSATSSAPACPRSAAMAGGYECPTSRVC